MSAPDAKAQVVIPHDSCVVAVIAALNDAGHQVRYAGGFVRDCLLNEPAGDVDLATTALPDQTLKALEQKNIRSTAPGFDHGTVIAALDGRAVEITTLRRDVVTDGRHAVVAFGMDWREDALRRDFTMNALFADPDGTVHDFVDGVADAVAGRVRFVGDPNQRIKEDHLRILRYFRFFARFGVGEPGDELLKTLGRHAGALETLSAERVTRETLGLLAAKDPSAAWRLMASVGIDRRVLGPAVEAPSVLGCLIAIEAEAQVPPSALRRLAQLGSTGRLVLSNAQTSHLAAVAQARDLFGADQIPSENQGRRALFQTGRKAAIDGFLIARSAGMGDDGCGGVGRGMSDSGIADFVAWLSKTSIPQFPLTGQDVLDVGIDPGVQVGALLRGVEQWWIGQGLKADRDACLDQLKSRVGAG